MNAVQPAAKEVVQLRLRTGNRKGVVLTQILVESSWVLELDVEVPASTEGTHRGLLPVALPANHADLRTIGTIWECTGYAKERIVNNHRRVALQNSPPTYFSGSSSWYEGSTILYCFGRSTQS
jgi:hypothetical protein